MAKNYYDILGVAKNASGDDIKRAFRKKAHEFHPDKQGGNADRFKEVNEAYQVLSDNQKRQQYDTYGTTFDQAARNGAGGFGSSGFEGFDFGGFGNGGFSGDFGDLGDIFGDIFGGRQERASRRNRGIDLEMGIAISFVEAVFGAEKEVVLEKRDKCKTCDGSGAQPGSKVVTCPKCHGQGQIAITRRTIFGVVQSRITCDRCEGTGKVPENPCTVCKGAGSFRQEKKLMVKIPAGIDQGQRIRIAGEGEAGYRGSSPGDLFLVMHISPHKEFSRDGHNLLKDQPVSFTQAALGAKVLLRTLDGDVEMKVPAGTQSGTVFKIKGKGVPYVNQPDKRGDLLVTARVVVPSKLSKKEKELLRKLAEESGETVEVDEGFWENIKNSF
jgi:molecular chaperone DnaJ